MVDSNLTRKGWGTFMEILLMPALIATYFIFKAIFGSPIDAAIDKVIENKNPTPVKECPFCLSTVPANATKCRFCASTLGGAELEVQDLGGARPSISDQLNAFNAKNQIDDIQSAWERPSENDDNKS